MGVPLVGSATSVAFTPLPPPAEPASSLLSALPKQQPTPTFTVVVSDDGDDNAPASFPPPPQAATPAAGEGHLNRSPAGAQYEISDSKCDGDKFEDCSSTPSSQSRNNPSPFSFIDVGPDPEAASTPQVESKDPSTL